MPLRHGHHPLRRPVVVNGYWLATSVSRIFGSTCSSTRKRPAHSPSRPAWFRLRQEIYAKRRGMTFRHPQTATCNARRASPAHECHLLPWRQTGGSNVKCATAPGDGLKVGGAAPSEAISGMSGVLRSHFLAVFILSSPETSPMSVESPAAADPAPRYCES